MNAGISGHQDIDTRARDFVASNIAEIVTSLEVTRGLTSLAIGADQMFAEVLRQLHIPYVAVLPSGQYESTFDKDRIAIYRALLASAASSVVLPHPRPSEAAYLDAGKFIVDSCDLLIAVWDGEAARGMGGTGDIVAYAKAIGRPTYRINTKRSLT